MIDLSKLDCPVVSILRRAFGIVKSPADRKKKEDTKKFSVPDASTQFYLPRDTGGQQALRKWHWDF